ncbi:hypothetical protein ABXN37_02010 [Piscinibacter sakaiensis]|uniref:Uncharacterized protein n=1 Tax=Piscinibacter sakaiensis TaxID=1547922 RepID=A0A0K8NVI7_PISS1|nr:hypothetical protein [Piscinibacter sakaiensis]GAP33950.1 hypothetical protein ISF6_2792 [Piscinibacter sakaiensis]
MRGFFSHLASVLVGLLLLGAAAGPAHAQFVTQGQVTAAQQAALSAARTAASFAAAAASYRQIAAQFAARAAQATNRVARAVLQGQANAWNSAANAAQAAANYWSGVADRAQAAYQALLRRFQTTTCRLLPQLPLCSVSRN